MTRTMSPAGRDALMRREGCRLVAYLDSVGVPTIGIGHTGRAGPPSVTVGMTITQAEADAILARDLAPFEFAVNRAVTGPITVNQFDACVSLAFNIGVAGFAGSTVVHKLNAGDVGGAADAFLMWVRPPELRLRRDGERAQFLKSDDPVAPSRNDIVRPVVAGPHILPRPKPSLCMRLWAALFRKAD